MKKIIFLIPFFLYASIYENFLLKKYSVVCSPKNINTNDEKLLSIVGISCVKSDKLYLLPLIINKLKKTKTGRTNSVYFATILLQKKLLYAFLFDKYPIDSFSFPKGDYILSVVFDNLKSGNYKKIDDKYIINLKNEIIYFYKKDDKMIIDEYKNGKLKSRWFR
ncbi:hypothetical protein FE773_08190 [Caminibacter mediatlanticus TB-2]|uniref:Peptide chain release factor 2 n=1 Tax=Caminibacter mediatlanticus TB-2 TaxID=391592 RepID=A0AAI9AJ17_9BACT|nr:hypothetical protein [Caminibacter mediatlanticus]EDM24526.1 peptide chain release factor 2 [Caminibacter mediatlanticus TB-2]QCT95171.1 hypothetical protein FE773_08190 [Caminibacter mediatlanticus TB-2]